MESSSKALFSVRPWVPSTLPHTVQTIVYQLEFSEERKKCQTDFSARKKKFIHALSWHMK